MASATERTADGALHRRLSVMLMLAAIGWGVFAIQYAAMGRWSTVQIDVVVVLGTVATSVAHRRRWIRFRLAAHLAMALSCGGLAAAALLSGQGAAMATWYLAAIPVFAAYLLGARETWSWAAAATVAVTALHVSSSRVAIEPEFVATGMEVFGGQIVLIGIVAGFAVVARHESDRRAADLEVARDRALAAVDARTRFLTNASHELRTPLNAAIGAARLLDEDVLPDHQRQLVTTILGSGHELRGLVEDLLDLSGGDEAPARASSRSFSLRDLLSTMLDDIDISSRVPESVVGDSHKVRRIVEILVALATKRGGGASLHVDADPRAAWVYLDVRCPIRLADDDAVDELLEPFGGARPEAGAEGRSGLGLHLARRLAELMGATLGASNPAEGGSQLRLTLPVSGARQSAALGLDPAFAGSAPLRILVAEDDEANRVVLQTLLQRLGYQPRVVEDGAAAVEVAARYDLILMDVHMPRVGGLEATRRIRTSCSHEPTIVGVSAGTLESDRTACFDAGMDDLIAKPVIAEELIAVLERVTSRADDQRTHAETGDADNEPSSGLERLRRLLAKRPGAYEDMVRKHIRNSGDLALRIAQAAERGDRGDLRFAAHSLKSSSALFDSAAVSSLSAEIETEAAEAPIEALLDKATHLRALVRHAHVRLEHEFEGPPAAHASS